VHRHYLTSLARQLLLVLLVGWPCISCWAQGYSATLKGLSPKLNQFLSDHPVASASLSKALSEAFGSRNLGLYYFYTDDESVARASHYYRNSTSVTIIVRENQLPSDECICLIFEILNSEGEPRFQQLVEMAKAGSISRVDYATEVLKQEFKATKKTRDLIATFEFSQKEIAESWSYNRLIQCPDDFNAFLPYLHKVSPNRHTFEDYERYYDLQKQYYDSLAKTPHSANAK
jgi:hypothetical protein